MQKNKRQGKNLSQDQGQDEELSSLTKHGYKIKINHQRQRNWI